jgi:hypothetical protein
MKKTLLTAALVFSCGALLAQDDSEGNLSKNGRQITPVAGDIGLGFDARPFLRYAGDIFGRTSSNPAPTSGWLNENMIFGKYFLDDETVARVAIGVNRWAETYTNKVHQDNQLNPNVFVEDMWTRSTGYSTIALGLEKRRGNHRIQGYYGAELAFSRRIQSDIFEYGNAIASDNINPTTTNWGANNVGASPVSGNFSRDIATYGGPAFGMGLNAIVGVEYFFAPRMSLGGEFSWGAYYLRSKEGERQTEEWNNGAIINNIRPTGTEFHRGLNTGNLNGAIYMMIYF